MFFQFECDKSSEPVDKTRLKVSLGARGRAIKPMSNQYYDERKFTINNYLWSVLDILSVSGELNLIN